MEIAGFVLGLIGALAGIGSLYEIYRNKPNLSFKVDNYEAFGYKKIDDDMGGNEHKPLDLTQDVMELYNEVPEEIINSISFNLLINNKGFKKSTINQYSFYLRSYDDLNAILHNESYLIITDNTDKKHKIKIGKPKI